MRSTHGRREYEEVYVQVHHAAANWKLQVNASRISSEVTMTLVRRQSV